MYCLYCFVSNNKENTRGGSHVFTVHGFDSCKRVCGKHCAFLTHIGSGPCSSHNNAVTSGHALMKQSCHIENVIAVKDKEKVDSWLNCTLIHIYYIYISTSSIL